jgi:serine/threonine protein kinase/formylglycine-generating enzyme required for sulfatase activity
VTASPTDTLPDTLLVDLLARMLSDRAGAGLRPLADYQSDFPGHAAAVESEWRRLQQGSATEAPAADGRRVGPYRLLRELGRGGQGTVWLAHDERLRRQVALKIVPRSPLVEDLAPRFRREAEVAGGLDHPGLCPVYDVGHDESVAWIALRYVEGETLAHRIARGPLPRDEALRLIESAARALHVAHAAGVVHRDVKPGNLMITPAGDAVVLDFGVARPQEGGPPITLTGDALGTPAYMSPEALGGAARLDARADVWALGVSLFEALAGRRPFAGPTREALVQSVMHGALELPRKWDRDLGLVLRTALSREPAARYRTAADLAEDLRRLRAHEPILARPTSAARRLLRWRRRNPALANSLAALALVLVAGLIVTALLLASTRRSLADVRRLSDHKLARDLEAQAETLWPAVPDRVPGMQGWLQQAQAVLGRRELHAQALAAAGGAPEPAPPAEASSQDIEGAWLRESLAQLLAELGSLQTLADDVQRRLDFARSVDRLTLEEPREAWHTAAAAVAADARFDGLVLAPQRGLIPLGADPDSRLQEFALLATGHTPARDAAGHLLLDDESAAVLVLVPGGPTTVGASPETDAWCAEWDGPPQSVRLDPFLIGKHELTQGQWMRHTGSNPSTYGKPSKEDGRDHPARHPVESVSFLDATRVLAQLGLELPTEVQWEHAARAGTTTPWWCGAEPISLQGCANVADRYAQVHGGIPSWHYSPEIDDGVLLHAAVGSYRANAFGLHDVAGNVTEWTRSTWEDWARFHPRDGDGACPGEETAPVVRGGTYAGGATEVRSSLRQGEPPSFKSFMLGLRIARRLER